MNKTLHTTFKSSTHKMQAAHAYPVSEQLALSALSSEMNDYLQAAAKDLLKPRPQAIAAILKKVHY
ncbi:MAG: hypothetical protein H0X33_15070 [Taibaiella sp.]|nr:hypothetical protein [Taibaiella sp.]